jgi:hypothetical protein
LDHIGERIVHLDDYKIVVISFRSAFLDLELHSHWRHSRACQIINIVQFDKRNKPAETTIQGLFTCPLPLTPSIGHCSVSSPIVSKVHRPHDTGVEIWCNRLISKDCEVCPPADVSVHGRGMGAIGFVGADDCIIGNNRAPESEESAVPINDKIVAATSADYVSASTEPAYLVGIVLISQEIAVCIAIGACDIEEVCICS